MKELFKTNKYLLMPEVYDVASTRCAELCGFKAVVLSSGELSMAMCGNPDMGLLNPDELTWVAQRLCHAVKVPVIIDAEGGFGRPLNVFNTVKKLSRCGIGGVIITDETEPYLSFREPERACCSIEEAVARMRAASIALEGTDAILVSRTDLDITEHYDEVVERCNRFLEAGATATMILSLNKIRNLEDRMVMLKRLSSDIPGPKWYPDLSSDNDQEDLDLDEIADLGFNMIGVHYLITAATYGMVESGRHLYEEKNTMVLERNMDSLPDAAKVLNGTVPKAAYIDAFGLTDGTWIELEKKFFSDDYLFAAKSYRMNMVMNMIEKQR